MLFLTNSINAVGIIAYVASVKNYLKTQKSV